MKKMHQNPPLQWFGGKHYLYSQIFPLPEHSVYTEVFGGGASMLFAKEPSDVEIYNDINDRLVNFWKQLQECPDDLVHECIRIGEIDSRTLFKEYMERGYDLLNDAARFFYVNRHSFSGNNASFHGKQVDYSTASHGKYLNILDSLKAMSARIKHIVIENQDFRKIICRYDKPNCVLYVDPPYIDGGDEYEKGIGGLKWTEEDLKDLIELCTNFTGKVIFSFDQNGIFPETWFTKEIIRTNFADKGTNGHQVKTEYAFFNYDPKIVATQCHKNQQKLF